MNNFTKNDSNSTLCDLRLPPRCKWISALLGPYAA